MSVNIELNPSVTINQPTPVRIALTGAKLPAGAIALEPENGGAALAAQLDGDAIVAIIPALQAGQTARYRVAEAKTAAPGVALIESAGTLELRLPEGQFSAYHYGEDVARPYLWPVFGPGQKRVTRNYPMEDVEGEETDHPHHRSIWTAFDEVNGVNNWSEEPGHGYTRHQEFTKQEQGPVFGGFTARGMWTSKDGQPVLSEERTVRVYNVGATERLMDYNVTLTAAAGDVEFGDTKEAGILAVRVATTMDGARGGLIANAEGGQGEAACWGKRSAWCDYSGPVEGEILGIAMLSHPENSGGAPRWHARDYGLITTNPLSEGAFTGGELKPFTLKNGESLRYNYRVLVHRGNAEEGQVAAVYQAFIEPPAGRVVA